MIALIALTLLAALIIGIAIARDFKHISTESDPFQRYMKRKAYVFGLTSPFYPPLWWSHERRATALRPYIDRWAREYR